ncbi:MAG: chromate transporter [Butyricicoccus sp.]|nr:chromate transporter [Butyricicoccus sp.]
MTREQRKKVLDLFWYFLKTGSYTFGGGWGIVLAIQKEFVDKRNWITEEELVDLTSVGRSLPGTMIGNVTYLFGYRQCGVAGDIASLIGVSLMPMLVMIAVTLGYESFKNNLYVARALTGVRASVIPIMLSSAITLRDACFTDKITWAIGIAAALLFLFADLGTLPLVLLAGLFGYAVCEVRSR